MDYKATLNLPKTAFPMKASLPESEPKMLAWWDQIGIYKRLRETAADRPLWILHDGPPYANGHIHMGHVLNKVLKDVIVKSRSMMGFNAVYVPGWDCHGLPIEHEVDKELGLDQATVDVRRAMDPVEKRRRCREYALRFIDIQRNEFRRLGVFGDWENPYITMTPAYQAVIAREFGRFVGTGVVYKGLKPVHWCMHCKTALAQAEVEYEDQTTQTVYVRFPVRSPSPALAQALGGKPASLVIWTTTPWTLPANLAIAADPKIVEHLRKVGALVAEVTLSHEYPHCWRCKNPTLFRATEQWFISLDKKGLRQRALEAVEHEVAWIPAWGRDRIFNMIAHRPDWTISRQRVWGVPIVAFYCEACEAVLLEERIVEHVARIFREGAGADEWHARPASALLPPGTRCAKCGSDRFRKETDILDVWFDSGCSHAAVLETRPELRWPAELYLEGSDQHRGWFHSSLLEAVGTRNAPPCKAVLTCGFVVDGEGRKMSKSGDNAVTPADSLAKYGAEVLRLWVAAEDYTEDIRLSTEIMDRLADAYRRIGNTYRFLLGNLGDFEPLRDRQSYARLDQVDRWVLDRLARLSERVIRAYDESQFHIVFHAVHNFCAVDLSALYLDIIKDRLYTSATDDPRRRAAQTTCYDLLDALLRLMAPILTFTAEEAWRLVPGAHAESVHLERFFEVPREWFDDTLERDWNRLLEVRREVAKALETAPGRKAIGSSLQAAAWITAAPEDLPALLRANPELFPTLFIVSDVLLFHV